MYQRIYSEVAQAHTFQAARPEILRRDTHQLSKEV